MCPVRRVLVVGLCLAGCGDDITDKTAMCKLSTTRSAATIEDRKVIGGVVPYAADLALAARDEELAHSIAARRQVAWEVVAKVLAPTPLAEPTLPQPFALPAWHTWFAKDDFDRMFKKL